jgi:predicted ribosomally synthesized peptide with SipW-like signal peptide
MNMIKKTTNFVLNKLHMKKHLIRTSEEGSTIRKTRLRKFRTKSKKLIIAAQIVAIWYLLIISVSYLTTNTGAYFNDVEKISGTIIAAEDFCKEFKSDKEKNSDYYKDFCKDNAGIGNGPEPGDIDTGEGTDPDNPGHNKDGCDDHTNAPCTRITNLKETHTSNSITLTWSNPNEDFDFVKVYRNSKDNLVGNNIKNGQFIDESLLPSTKYSYIITAINSSGKESSDISIDVTTGNDTVDNNIPEEVIDLIGNRNGNSQNITLSWKRPTGTNFVKIYVEGHLNPIIDNYTDNNIKLTSIEEVTYRITTVDSEGNESIGKKITIKKE